MTIDPSTTPTNPLEMDLTGITVEQTVDSAKITDAQSNTFLTAVAADKKVSIQQAAVAVAIICQKGGTAKKAQGSVYAIVNGTRYDLKTIRSILDRINAGFTLRQWARSNATFIYKVAETYDIIGDLAKKLGRDDDSISRSEEYWLSNFQMDNIDCPVKIRNLLMNHYKILFGDR